MLFIVKVWAEVLAKAVDIVIFNNLVEEREQFEATLFTVQLKEEE